MGLDVSILAKITSLYALVSQIDRYWATIDFTKSTQPNKSMELEVRVYTFLEEDGEADKRTAYIIKEKINLKASTAEQALDYLLRDVKDLIVSKEEEEARCQAD